MAKTGYMKINILREKLESQNSKFEIIQHEKPIKSRSDALDFFRIEEMVPTLIIKADKEFYALIFSGERVHIDFDKVKELLDCRKISMANRQEIVEKYGIVSGQVPLIGHNLPCIIDKRIFKNEFVYGGTGDLYYTLKINPNDLVKANRVVLEFD